MSISKRSYGEDAVRSDRTGKVFVVLGQNNRKCLICEQVFTRNESGEHANVICCPSSVR
jgi:hypothetical protein